MASEKSSTAITKLLKCHICLEGPRNCHVCGHCAQFLACIDDWIKNDRKCPSCRQNLAGHGRLFKVGTFGLIQEQLNQLLQIDDDTQNRCGHHPKDHLSLYCQRCQKCICARCMYSDQHLDHKDEVVLFDNVYDLYEHRLQSLMAKLEFKRDVTIETMLTSIKGNLNTLTKLLNEDVQILEATKSTIENLQHLVEESLSAKKDATNLQIIMNLLAFLESFVIEEAQVSGEIENRVLTLSLPNPATFKFELDLNVAYDDDDLLSDPLTVDGFRWMVKLSRSSGRSAVYLCLLEGTPGEYAVSLGDEPLRLIRFKLSTFVLLREDAELDRRGPKPNSAVVVVVHIQQARTFQEKCTQQARYIEQFKQKIGNSQ